MVFSTASGRSRSPSGRYLSVFITHGVHFEQASVGDIADLDQDARRAVAAHERGVDGIEGIEVIQVRHEDGCLRDIGNTEPRGIQDSLQVGKRLLRLLIVVPTTSPVTGWKGTWPHR